MSRVAFVNGRYVAHRAAQVHVEDRGYQFADGVYEVLYVHDGRLIDADLHLDRLDRSLAELRIRRPVGRAALLAIVAELRRRNRVRSGLVYLQVTRGVARRDHAFPPAATAPSLVATIRRTPPFPANPENWTATAITVPDQRWARCDIKSVGLLANVLARQQARDRGAVEAIMFDAGGMVTEGASTTVWIVDAAGVLRTRPLSHAILPGCTRGALLEELKQAGVALQESAFSVAELGAAQEVFLTSATSFVKPVLAIDGAAMAGGKVGPVTRVLFRLFARHVAGGAAEETAGRPLS